jgi:hypothetical protein
MRSRYVYIILLFLLLIPTFASATTVNWSIGTNTSYTIDFVNSSYAKPFFYSMLLTNGTPLDQYPIMGMFVGLMGVYTDAMEPFGGVSLLYLAFFGLFVIMLYRSSGSVSIPALASVIIGSAWGMLIPESAIPYALILLAFGVTAQLYTFWVKE